MAHYSTNDNNKHTHYLGLIDDPEKGTTYQWEKDLLFDFDLILEFEKEISKRNMLKMWPFPGYKWQGPGTCDYLVEDLAEENDEPVLPECPNELQCCRERFIWYHYSVS